MPKTLTPKPEPPAPVFRAPLVADPQGDVALWPHRPERFRRMTPAEVSRWQGAGWDGQAGCPCGDPPGEDHDAPGGRPTETHHA